MWKQATNSSWQSFVLAGVLHMPSPVGSRFPSTADRDRIERGIRKLSGLVYEYAVDDD